MNRKMRVLVWTIGLCVLGIMVLNSCIATVPAPTPEPTPVPSPAPAPVPEPAPVPTFTIIECPNEAHIGEYITVKIRVPDNNDTYLLRIADERLHETGIGIYYIHLGKAIPDKDLIVCWYVAIPAEGGVGTYIGGEVDYSLRPGDYKLQITTFKDQDNLLMNRNFIIKE